MQLSWGAPEGRYGKRLPPFWQRRAIRAPRVGDCCGLQERPPTQCVEQVLQVRILWKWAAPVKSPKKIIKWIRSVRAVATRFEHRNGPWRKSKGEPIPDSSSTVRLCPMSLRLSQVRAVYVYKCHTFEISWGDSSACLRKRILAAFHR